jgi:hypothetical protein
VKPGEAIGIPTNYEHVWFGFFVNSFSEKLAVGKNWWLEFRCLIRQLWRKAVG